MKSSTAWQAVRLIAFVACVAFATRPAVAAKSAVKMTKLTGSVELTTEAPVPFTLAGVASHLGNFTAAGEVQFEPGEEEGSLVGAGPVVFKSANGDLLVGEVAWDVVTRDDGSASVHLHFGWRDTVEFSDGTVVASSGRFTDNRPPGLTVENNTARTLSEPSLLVRLIISIFSR